MSKSTPGLTPFAARKHFDNDINADALEHDGWVYILDAPRGCSDPEYFFPVATEIGNEENQWFPTGELTDKITETTEWAQ